MKTWWTTTKTKTQKQKTQQKVTPTPKLMVLIIANLGNVAIGLTAFFILYVNTRYLPPQIRPGLLQKAGLIACGVFYLGMAALVYYHTQKPIIDEFFFGKGGS